MSVDNSYNRISEYSDIEDDYEEPSAPKFEPPVGEDVDVGEDADVAH
jgi:hypothetical protein